MAAPDLAAPSAYTERITSRRPERCARFRELFKTVIAVAEVSADFAASTLGFIAANVAASSLFGSAQMHWSLQVSASTGAILGLLVVVLVHREGGYRGSSGLLRIRDTESAIRISAQSLAIVCVILFLMGQGLDGSGILIAIALIPTLQIGERQILFAIARSAQRAKIRNGCAVVYGTGDNVRGIISALLDSPRLGLYPAAVIDDGAGRLGSSLSAFGYKNRASIQVWPGPVTPFRLQSLQCDTLLIATDELLDHERDVVVRAGREAGCDVLFFTGRYSQENGPAAIDIDGLLFTSTARHSTQRFYSATKRITDLVVSSALLIILAPLLLLIAFVICLDSPGRALFIQTRVGKNGKLFRIHKFRTMYSDAREYSPSPQSSSDPRITRIGRLLRRTNLDELPQLLNVLAGTMSLVGPRPEMPFIAERYNAHHRQRLEVIPGITGLWQLSADRSFPIHENIEYDLYYIRNRGIFLDLAILAHTLMFAMTGGI